MEEKKNAAPLVVKLSGKALGAEKELERLCRELKSAGRAFLLVHGGGVAVDRLMADLGIEVRRVRGLRVSPAEEMPGRSPAPAVWRSGPPQCGQGFLLWGSPSRTAECATSFRRIRNSGAWRRRLRGMKKPAPGSFRFLMQGGFR